MKHNVTVWYIDATVGNYTGEDKHEGMDSCVIETNGQLTIKRGNTIHVYNRNVWSRVVTSEC